MCDLFFNNFLVNLLFFATFNQFNNYLMTMLKKIKLVYNHILLYCDSVTLLLKYLHKYEFNYYAPLV